MTLHTTASPPPARIAWIDAAKGACIFMVILWHVATGAFNEAIYNDLPLDVYWTGLLTLFQPLRMPLFFVISGFLAHSAITRRPWGQSLTSRILMLGWLYILWASILLIYRTWLVGAFAPEQLEIAITGPIDYLAHLLLADNTIWYLYALVIYFTLCKALKAQPVVLLGGLFLLYLGADRLTDITNFSKLIGYGFFYAAGCFGKPWIERFYADVNVKRLLGTLIVLPIVMLTGRQFDLFYHPVTQFLMSCLMVSVSIDMLSLLLKRWSLGWFQALGKQTLPVYVLHMLLIYPMALAFSTLAVDTQQGTLLFASLPLLLGFAVLGLSLGIYHVLNRGPMKALFDLPKLSMQRSVQE
ncbi:acyltransferase family protein [Larsenimonas suaedae]|uniref:Acyltransferase n=1 Tax=Larsenimonas suaedae TaxID=1851019 RepID=A0ABU1GS45_9GAMM|nr:acyltransferase [Larsenimonas suaedae]MCM2972549.1 acyltransferase [Larsenimonas suaedae]MDR5894655.1 acyltransferase [Larsenimonas suaedae]